MCEYSINRQRNTTTAAYTSSGSALLRLARQKRPEMFTVTTPSSLKMFTLAA
jgi:hypothetical protein